MSQIYSKELKTKIIKLHLEQGRSIKSLTSEYHLGKGTLSYWIKELRKECQIYPDVSEQVHESEVIRRQNIELAELRKENDFLKKAAAFFAKQEQ